MFKIRVVFIVSPKEQSETDKFNYWREAIWQHLSEYDRYLWSFYRIDVEIEMENFVITLGTQSDYSTFMQFLYGVRQRYSQSGFVLFCVSDAVIDFIFHQYGDAHIQDRFAWVQMWGYQQVETWVRSLSERFTVDYEHAVKFWNLVAVSHELCHLLLGVSGEIDGGPMSGGVFYRKSFWGKVGLGWLLKPAERLVTCHKAWAPLGEKYEWDEVLQRYSTSDPYCEIPSLYKKST